MSRDALSRQSVCQFDGEEDTVCPCDNCTTRAISLGWERATGCDSVDTIERIYERSIGGAYVCIWPGCTFKRRDPVALWWHVHSAAHVPSKLPPVDFDPTPWL